MTVLVQDELLESTLVALGEVAGDAEFLITSVERMVCARDAIAALPVRAAALGVPAVRAVVASAFVAAIARG